MPNSAQPNVRSAALSTGVVIGDAPYAIERSARVVALGGARHRARASAASSARRPRSSRAGARAGRGPPAASNSLTRIVVAPFHSPRNAQPMPPMWNIGSGVRLTRVARRTPSAATSRRPRRGCGAWSARPSGRRSCPTCTSARPRRPAAPRPPGVDAARARRATPRSPVADLDHAQLRPATAAAIACRGLGDTRGPAISSGAPASATIARELRHREPPVERHERRRRSCSPRTAARRPRAPVRSR